MFSDSPWRCTTRKALAIPGASNRSRSMQHRWNEKLRWPWYIRRARFGGRIAQLRGASWPTNNGRRSLSDRRGTRNTVPLGSWSQAKLLSQCSCSPGDRGDRWRRNAKSAFISQTRSRAQTFLTWVYGERAWDLCAQRADPLRRSNVVALRR